MRQYDVFKSVTTCKYLFRRNPYSHHACGDAPQTGTINWIYLLSLNVPWYPAQPRVPCTCHLVQVYVSCVSTRDLLATTQGCAFILYAFATIFLIYLGLNTLFPLDYIAIVNSHISIVLLSLNVQDTRSSQY